MNYMQNLSTGISLVTSADFHSGILSFLNRHHDAEAVSRCLNNGFCVAGSIVSRNRSDVSVRRVYLLEPLLQNSRSVVLSLWVVMLLHDGKMAAVRNPSPSPRIAEVRACGRARRRIRRADHWLR